MKSVVVYLMAVSIALAGLEKNTMDVAAKASVLVRIEEYLKQQQEKLDAAGKRYESIRQKYVTRERTAIAGMNEYSVPLAKARDEVTAITEHMNEVRGIRDRLPKLQPNEEEYDQVMRTFAALPRTLQPGQWGWVHEAKVLQIIDATQLRAMIGDTEVYATGFNTSGIRANTTVRMGWVRVKTPVTYTTILGGQRTLHHVASAK